MVASAWAVVTIRPPTQAMKTFIRNLSTRAQSIHGAPSIARLLASPVEQCSALRFRFLLLLVAFGCGLDTSAFAAAVDVTTLHSFGFTNLIGRSPEAALTRGSDGLLYGTARLGGRGNRGTVFRVHPDGTGFLVIHNFYGTNGQTPTAEVIEGSDGWLYGTAFQGGAANRGVVFRLGRDGVGFALLHEFGLVPEDGGGPAGSLLEGRDGWLYGTCFAGGGTNDAGTVFKLGRDGGGYARLHEFAPAHGSGPQGGLVEARDGRLYGTCSRGGEADEGTVFGLDRDGGAFANLREFDGTDGSSPVATLIEGSDGGLYGTARDGGASGFGTVFRVSNRGDRFTVLWDFFGPDWDGFRPFCTLVEGGDGALYGTTAGGGEVDGGIVFRINKDGSAYEVLRSLGVTFAEGKSPFNGLLRLADGRLFGTTFSGGGANAGCIFTLREDGSEYRTMWSFSASGGDGITPTAAMIEGRDGVLYGATDGGGYYAQGTVFRMQKDGGGYQVLHDFTGSEGQGRGPVSALIEGGDGSLYGTTAGEETFGTNLSTGLLFKLNKDGTGFTALHQFLTPLNRVTPDGIRPVGGLLEARDGLLYGFTGAAGTNGFGTLYRIDTNGTNYEVVFHLARTNGGFAGAALMQSSDGMLYAVAAGSPQRTNGAVFRLNTDGTGLHVLRNFSGGDGSVPLARLLEGSDGRLYGTTTNGGLAGRGVLFRMEKDGAHFTVLRSFRGGSRDGAHPYSSLIEGQDGELYGTTREGGARDRGVLYRIGKDGLRYTVLHYFYDSDPIGGRSASALWQGSDGVFHGTTPVGGDLGMGTLFRMTKRFPYLESTITPYGFLLRFNGLTNQPYVIQRSTNLTDWVNLLSITLREPFIEYEDANLPPGAAFYRMLPQ